MATRREFLAGAAGLCLAGGRVLARGTAPRLASAVQIGGESKGAIWSSEAFAPFDVPARGHGLARLGGDSFALMGRRPGLLSSIVDAGSDAKPLRTFEPAKNKRFAGHAAVSEDGSLFVTSEFDPDTFEACVVSRDPVTAAERACWALNGIEPHDLVFARGGTRLVVALGGLVHDGGAAGPAYNPDGVRSEVVEVDPRSGSVVARHRLPPKMQSLSLRHLSVSPDGARVAVAAQDQDLSERRPLIGLLSPGGDIGLLPMPDPQESDLQGYVGSVAFDRSGMFIAAASPRASLIGLWSVSPPAWIGSLAIADVCGLAAGAEDGSFWASSGHGGIYRIAASARGPRLSARWSVPAGFDNHLLLI